MNLQKFLRATVVGATLLLATEVYAEQLCFRTSDCEETEVCKPVSGSAMGICKALVDRQAQRRAQDTENFSTGSTIGNFGYGATPEEELEQEGE